MRVLTGLLKGMRGGFRELSTGKYRLYILYRAEDEEKNSMDEMER